MADNPNLSEDLDTFKERTKNISSDYYVLYAKGIDENGDPQTDAIIVGTLKSEAAFNAVKGIFEHE